MRLSNYKNLNLDPFGSEVCAFCTTLYIFQRGQPPDIHVQFLGFLVLMNYLPGQIPLKMPLKLRLPLLTGSPLTDCWGLFLSADFSSKCWTVILFLLVLGKLEFCSWRLGWVVHHYPFLHFWLMVSGVSVLGSLVPIAQDL